jgi:hypothetical protein
MPFETAHFAPESSYCRTPVSRMKIICRPRPAEPDLLFFKKSHGK